MRTMYVPQTNKLKFEKVSCCGAKKFYRVHTWSFQMNKTLEQWTSILHFFNKNELFLHTNFLNKSFASLCAVIKSASFTQYSGYIN